MYIFIWGESSIKMSEPGEYYHTDTHTRIRSHAQKQHSEIFARETNSYKQPSKTHVRSGKPKPFLFSSKAGARTAQRTYVFGNLGLSDWDQHPKRRGSNSAHQMGFSKPSQL